MSSVDDLEELIATRKLHGLNDNLYKESDKNVAIKESIEIVKKFNKENRYRDCGRVNNAIDTLIYVAENSIPVQKVIDLMEKEKLPLTIVGGRGNSKTLAYGIKLGKIKACEELLEEK